MKKFIIAALTFAPAVAFAQSQPTLGNLTVLLNSVKNLVNLALPIVVSIALLVFFWGLVQHLAKSGDKNAAEGARNTMIWGVVALFVMVSVWGLTRFVGSALNISSGGAITPSKP